MKKIIFVVWALSLICLVPHLYAAEHGGKEHGGKEHGGMKISEPSAADIHKAMKGYIDEKSKATGTFDVYDPEFNKTRKLTLIRIHKRVGKTGNYYYSCADFKDVDTVELLDLDLDVENIGGKLNIVEVRVHKVGGKERYTYDKNDNRIPVKKY